MITVNDQILTLRQRLEMERKKGVEEFREKLHADLASRGMKPLTDDEYKEAVRKNHQNLLVQQAAAYKPDYARIGIREADLSLTWDAVKRGYSDGDKARDEVRNQFEKGFGLIFLWGNYGQAKTLLGKILTVQAFASGKRAAYANMSAVLNDIRLSFDEQEFKTTELLRRLEWWKERDVLFIDELDKVNSTPWANEQIFTLLDYRYMLAIREQSLTVVASNKSDGELDGYLKSRLNDRRVGPVLHLNGSDGRQFMPDTWRY